MPQNQNDTVPITGPDGKPYSFPKGTTKDQAISYFKSKGIGAPTKKAEEKLTFEQTPIGQQVEAAKGVGKGLLETGTALSPLINKIPGVGEYLAPKEGIAAAKDIAKPTNTAQTVGKIGEGIGEFALGETAFAKGAKAVAMLPRLRSLLGSTRYAKVVQEMVKAGAITEAQARAHGEEHPETSALTTAATAGLGEYVGKPLQEAIKKSGPKIYESVNRYIGLQKTDLPKWERLSLEDAQEVGKTVAERAGIKGTLDEQAKAIEAARSGIQDETDALITSSTGRLVNLHGNLRAIKTKLTQDILKRGLDVGGSATRAVAANEAEFMNYAPNLTAKKALELRQTIGKDIHWNSLADTTDIRQMYLAELYSSLNEGIKNALGTADAARFSSLNRQQSRLIIARDAAREKILAKSLGIPKGFIARTTAGALAGAHLGGLGGYVAGGDWRSGAEKGAIAGALVGAVAGPSAEVREKQALQQLFPALKEAAKKSPKVARALEIYEAQGGGSGSFAAQ